MAASATSSEPSNPGGLRASDAERDAAAGQLGEHYAEGRLSQHTFQHRMNAAMEARHRSDLPPLLADLPPRGPSRAERARGWLASGWAAARQEAGMMVRSLTTAFPPVPDGRPAAVPAARALRPLRFPRGSGTSFTIGRDSECDLTLEDPTVSRAHAILQRDSGHHEGGWVLTDQGSTNGTRVNGWRVRGTVPVRAGDVVRFGEAEYTLTPSGE